MEYVRLSTGLTNYKLIPASENYFNIISKSKDGYDQDYYLSIFRYNQEQYNYWKKMKTISGITDVITNTILFDFDSAANIELAQQDALALVSRLLAKDIPTDQIQIAFSGNKGFSVQVDTTTRFTQAEFKNITFALASDLNTFDRVVNDASRIFRIIGTKHPKSNLYKFPLTAKQLGELTIEQIKEQAKDHNNIDLSITGAWVEIEAPESILSLRIAAKKETTLAKQSHDLNMGLKPKWLSEAKFALQEGFFEEGERNQACMILAATYKNQGFSKEIVYNILKATLRLRAQRLGIEDYDRNELWATVIHPVFKSDWDGGTYSYETTPLLQVVTERLGLRAPNADAKRVVTVGDMNESFMSFAKDFTNNRIQTGIPGIDEDIMLTTGMMVGLLGAPSSGKCLGKGTLVRMFDGTVKPVEDIYIGDKLMGDDSTARTVLSLARGREEMFKVEQENGEDYTVNRSHILSLKCGASMTSVKLKHKYVAGKLSDISVNDYIASSGRFKKYYKGYKVGVEYSEKELPLDPYFLGLWLGDGSSSKCEITNVDDAICDYIEQYGEENGMIYSNTGIQHRLSMYKVGSSTQKNPILQSLKVCGVFNNKHIPAIYKTASRKQRLSLLAGLIDSDGYLNVKNNKYEIAQTNSIIANDIVELVRSLGFKATLTIKNKHFKSLTKGKLYEGNAITNVIYFSGESLGDIPVLLERKKSVSKPMRTEPLLTTLKLTSLGEGDYYGFTIDGNRRFLLNDYTVTHNTAHALNILEYASRNGTFCGMGSYDMYDKLLNVRLLQKYCNYDFKKMMEIASTGTLDKKMLDAVVEVNDAFKNVAFDFSTAPSVENIYEFIDREEQRTGRKMKLLVIDYLEKITGPYSDATANSGYLAGRLADLAKDKNLCLLLLLQPQKHAGDPSDALLSMRNVKGSSRVEQDLRLILTTWRYGFNPEDNSDDKYSSIAVVKNNMGPVGKYDFKWDGLSGKVRPLMDEDREDLKRVINEQRMRKAAKANSDGL